MLLGKLVFIQFDINVNTGYRVILPRQLGSLYNVCESGM